MNVHPASSGLGVEITDVHLPALSDEQVAEIRRLVYREKIVVFRDQAMDEVAYLEAARRFGRPQVYFQDHYHHPEYEEIFVSSNVKQDGQKVGVAGTGRFWHTDYSFFDEPLSTVFIYPQIVPTRGSRATYHIDMERVWRDLPEDLKNRVRGTHSFHEVTWYYKVQPWDIDRALIDLVRDIRAEAPGAVHPTVIRHPVTGVDILYISEGFTSRILELGHEESRQTLKELFAFIDQPQYVHAHQWSKGDLLFWDNRGLIHRASENESGEESMSYRIGVYDDQPFYVRPDQESRGRAMPSPPASASPAEITASDLFA